MPCRNGAHGLTPHQEEAVLAFTSFVPSTNTLNFFHVHRQYFPKWVRSLPRDLTRPSEFGVSRIGGPLCTSVDS